MIARIWHGMTSAANAAAYLRFLEARAIPDYRSVPGNLGASILYRLDRECAHFQTITWWKTRKSIERFAGKHIEVAKYYPEDERFLLEFEPTVTHWHVSDGSRTRGGGGRGRARREGTTRKRTPASMTRRRRRMRRYARR
jgi:hypothetical protein